MKQRLTRVALIIFASSLSMQAAVILQGVQEAQGGGFGNFDNFLTLTAGGGQPPLTKEGCVAAGGGGTVVAGPCDLAGGGTFTGGDEHNPDNTQFANVFAFDGTSAGGIQIGFNASETGNANSVTVDNLILTLYSDTDGTALYSTSGVFCGGVSGCVENANGSITLTTQSGIGNFGFIFTLDAPQAGELNAAGAGNLGLAAALSGASGGLDTFFFQNTDGGGGGSEIPEPMTFGFAAAGLAGVALLRRFR
jgi:hypothetical protein